MVELSQINFNVNNDGTLKWPIQLPHILSYDLLLLSIALGNN